MSSDVPVMYPACSDAKAHQVGHLDRGSETRNGIARREPLEQFGRRVFVCELGVDHPRTDGVHRDAELAELLRGGPRQPEHARLGRRVMRAAKRAHRATGR